MAKQKKTTGTRSRRLPLTDGFPDHLEDIAASLGRYTFDGEIAKGKTGVAYRLRSAFSKSHLYCLKTIRPDILDANERERVRDTIQKEVEILDPLTHRCLPTVYERRVIGPHPYYVCTYHHGTTFAEFRKNRVKLTFQQSAFAIWSLMDVLKYVHAEGRTHCDLHANNIMIDADVFRHGIMMIDFGSGHRESDSTPDTPNRGNVNFKTVANQGQDGARVDRHKMAQEFQKADFNALGKLLAVMQNTFFADGTPALKSAYDDFCYALQQGRIVDWAVVEDRFLSVLDPYRLISANASLFQSKDGRPQFIPLPVSGSVPVGTAPLAIINTPIFQRMRAIKQLSFCDWYFPGAGHSRFEHSLGTFGVAKLALEALVHDRTFRDVCTPDQARGLLLASLVHDIGHYPFAHVLEQYVASRFPDSHEAKAAVSHEKYTLALLDGDPDLSRAIKEHWGDDAKIEALRILEGNVPVLSQLLDGPIDLDKIDYLARDAAHCGVAYGSGLDADGLLKAMRCVENSSRLAL